MGHNILIYSDSTAFPRPPLVNPHETWPSILSRDSKSIYVRGDGGITIPEIKKIVARDFTYFGLEGSGNLVVILAFGIVDMAPRPITYKLAAIKNLPFLGKYLWLALSRFLSPHREIIQKFMSYQLTKTKQFKRDLIWIMKKIDKRNNICILTTPMPSSYVCKRSPGLEIAIKNLNRIKRECVDLFPSATLLEIDDILDLDYVSIEDGHHFGKSGHKKIAHRIENWLLTNRGESQ